MKIFKQFLVSAILVNSLPAFAQAPEFWNKKGENFYLSPSKLFGLKEFSWTSLEQFDESLNFQPQLNLYNEASQLSDLFGTRGSQLCAPVSLTHGFTYLRYPLGFSKLLPVGDLDNDGHSDSYRDKMRYFFNTCNTDKEIGTYYSQAIRCMKDYVQASGYKPYVYMIGPHSPEAPEGYPIETNRHVLSVNDLRAYVGNRLMVVMGIGWYTYNAATGVYTREGGHFFNVYGYDYNQAWDQERIVLKVVNSWSNYSDRHPSEYFDNVTMTKLPNDGTTYPQETAYELRGPGFDFTQRAFVEDIFVALPLAN